MPGSFALLPSRPAFFALMTIEARAGANLHTNKTACYMAYNVVNMAPLFGDDPIPVSRKALDEEAREVSR